MSPRTSNDHSAKAGALNAAPIEIISHRSPIGICITFFAQRILEFEFSAAEVSSNDPLLAAGMSFTWPNESGTTAVSRITCTA